MLYLLVMKMNLLNEKLVFSLIVLSTAWSNNCFAGYHEMYKRLNSLKEQKEHLLNLVKNVSPTYSRFLGQSDEEIRTIEDEIEKFELQIPPEGRKLLFEREANELQSAIARLISEEEQIWNAFKPYRFSDQQNERDRRMRVCRITRQDLESSLLQVNASIAAINDKVTKAVKIEESDHTVAASTRSASAK